MRLHFLGWVFGLFAIVTLAPTPGLAEPATEGFAATALREAHSFDGKQQFVSVPNAATLNFGTGNFSLCAWVRTSEIGRVDVILDKRVETSGPVQGYALMNYQGQLLLQLADRSGKGWTDYPSRLFIADGNWHHVAVTVDRRHPNGGRWYLDGVEAGQAFDTTDRQGSLDNELPLSIGRRADDPGGPGFFRGSLGDVRLFRRVLSPAEVQEIAIRRR